MWITATAVAALLVILSWTLSSPLGASPDDDFHQASIWCPHPVESSGCEVGRNDEGLQTVRVPAAVTAGCYRQQPQMSAGECPIRSEEVETARFDRGDYPGPYYRVLHLLASDHPARSILMMRLTNGVLAVALTALALVVSPRPLRRTLTLALLGTWVPLGVYLVASVNPSSWALAGLTTYWCLLLALLTGNDDRWRIVASSVGVAIAGLVATVSRADAAAYVIISTVAVVLLVRPPRAQWHRLWVSAGVCAVATLVFITSRQAEVVQAGIGQDKLDRTFTSLLFVNLTELPELIAGALGTWGLGALDTDMPATTWFVCIGVFCGLLAFGLQAPSRRKLLAVGLVAAALVAVPMRVLMEGNDYVGEQVQPRYLLPLLPVLLGLSLVQSGRVERRVSSANALLIWGALVVAQSLALHATLRRYVTGQDVRAFNLDHAREWWWWSTPGPMALWGLGTIAFGFVCWSLLVRPDRALGEIDAVEGTQVGSTAPGKHISARAAAQSTWH